MVKLEIQNISECRAKRQFEVSECSSEIAWMVCSNIVVPVDNRRTGFIRQYLEKNNEKISVFKNTIKIGF